jgi:RES domain-containing protein
MHTIFIQDTISLMEISEENLPLDWNAFPHTRLTQKIGDSFIIKNEFCVLKVPSVVTKGDFNILINPFHQEFNKIKVEDITPFKFDDRLFK